MVISLENKIFAYGTKCQGASHISENIPCQDSFLIKNCCIQNKDIIIMAVADGHGNKAYDLSEYGSKIAVNSAVEIMIEMYKNFNTTKKELHSNIRSCFPKELLNLWRQNVIDDIAQREPEFFEINKENKEKIYKRYGTTLIVCLICPEGIFFEQIGDGNILTIDEINGELNIYYPIIDNSDLLSNETYSLTSKNQLNLWNFNSLTTDKKTLIFMCTDGLYNSFATNEQFEILPKNLYLNLVKSDNETEFVDLLPEYLKKASELGSGDDITIAFALVNEDFIKIN